MVSRMSGYAFPRLWISSWHPWSHTRKSQTDGSTRRIFGSTNFGNGIRSSKYTILWPFVGSLGFQIFFSSVCPSSEWRRKFFIKKINSEYIDQLIKVYCDCDSVSVLRERDRKNVKKNVRSTRKIFKERERERERERGRGGGRERI